VILKERLAKWNLSDGLEQGIFTDYFSYEIFTASLEQMLLTDAMLHRLFADRLSELVPTDCLSLGILTHILSWGIHTKFACGIQSVCH
jgi:hypothetical protein